MTPNIDVNILATILGIVVNLFGLGYIAVRVEHRLTKMETHIEHLMYKKERLQDGLS